MVKQNFILIFSLCYFLAQVTGLAAQEAAALLSTAVYEEEVNGDLEKAIELYIQIIKEYPNIRPTAAEALLRLGITHEKLGRTIAREYYLQLLNNYSDQMEFATRARSRLTKLNPLVSEADKPKKESLTLLSEGMLKTSKVYFPGFAVRSISPDGRYLTYAAALGNLAIYDRINDKTENLTPDPLSKDKGRELGAKGISTRTIWSPDSKKIAYFWVREDEGDDLRIFDLETKRYTILCPYKEDGVPFPLEWTQDGAFILGAIWNKKTNIQKIVFVDVNNHSIRVVKILPPNDLRRNLIKASISHDGRYIIYEDINTNNKWDLFILSLENTFDRHLFGDIVSNEIDPIWLKDGKSFLFFSDRSKTSALWKATLNDEMQVEHTELLVEGLGWIYHHIGLTTDDTYYYWSHVRILTLYTNKIDLEKSKIGEEQIVASANLGQRMTPTWSHDGEKIAYLRINDQAPNKIEIKDLKTGIEQVLDFDLGPDVAITYQTIIWSANDSRLLFCVRNTAKKPGVSYFSGTVFEIVLGDIESGQYTTVVQNGKIPLFGSDEIIYFVRDRTIVELDLNSGKEVIIYSSDQHHINNMSISPDGTQMVFLIGPKDNGQHIDELVLMSLEDKSFNTIWAIGNGEEFGHNIRWFKNSRQLLVDVFPNDTWQQQLYHYDIATNTKRKLGEPLEGIDNVLMRIDINSDNSYITYMRRKNTISLWKLENY